MKRGRKPVAAVARLNVDGDTRTSEWQSKVFVRKLMEWNVKLALQQDPKPTNYQVIKSIAKECNVKESLIRSILYPRKKRLGKSD